MRLFTAIVTAALLCAVASTFLAGQDRTAELRSRFEHEPNPVQKAKLMPELGEAEFQQVRKDLEDQRVAEALNLLRDYDSQVNTCVKSLAGTNVDPDKHPAGFKQLQISIRESLRHIDALVPSMTSDQQAPFLEIRKDLDEVDRHLIEQLFPGRTLPQKSDKVVQ